MFPFIAEATKQPSRFDCLKPLPVLELEALTYSPFHVLALIFFVLAIVHTLFAYKIHDWARHIEARTAPHTKDKKWRRGPLVQALYFLSEIEIVFAIWAIPLFLAIAFFYNWDVAIEYIDTRDFTEPLFVAVILCLASTKPIVNIAEKAMHWCAKGLGGSLSAWWFTILTLGPLLGSLITEPGAMALSALLLSRQFYQYNPSPNLSYATLALLFVNISVGGTLTNFASPAALVLAHAWDWSNTDMLHHFGWKSAVGIVLANISYWFLFRQELFLLDVRRRAVAVFREQASRKEESATPRWVTAVHLFFIFIVVAVSHFPAMFLGTFLLFLGFHQATRHHQNSIKLLRPLLVGLFLAGLVIHGGLQGWWVIGILDGLTPLSVMGVAMGLTAFNDNTAISYLATLIPNWGPLFEYAIFTGVIAGGGLTVIANAPNPAGYAILSKHFGDGIRPIKLFLAALPPTLLLYALFYFFGPLFIF